MTLQELKDRCYTPYSGQPDYVMVRGKTGGLYPGIRIENISFPLTISAVQCALVICLSEGAKPETLYLPGDAGNPSHLNFWKNEFDLTLDSLSHIKTEPSEISETTNTIKNQLKALLDHAMVPYSHFPVAALLETTSGFISGVNLEFSAWEMGLCAERVAIAKALAYGVTRKEITALHLHTRHGQYSSPCGACRQVIIEHFPRIPIVIYHPDGSTSRHFSSDLLPYSFTSDFFKGESTKQVDSI